MQAQEIRQAFLDFFAQRGHTILPSASLVPENDPTVLFTTAGMQPLVPFLLGQPHPAGTRLVNVQKCVRTQDIEEVGDNRHDTFFEMLGNWSLGDYGRKETIAWSFEFLTEVLKLDPAKMYVTVFAGDDDAARDEEAIKIWQELFASEGVKAEVGGSLEKGGRIFPMPKDSNWWGPAGLTGPCGPDSEIHYDSGIGTLTLPDGTPDFESGRIIEIWNNVFMEYTKTAEGAFLPLQQKNIDTGMGLERIAMISQGKEHIFETDLFAPIIEALRAYVVLEEKSERIVVDHLRTSVMMIADGVRPANKDRGYILRRLLRRALLFCGLEHVDWISSLVGAIIHIYQIPYPELVAKRAEIEAVILEEGTKFQKTLAKGKIEIEKRTNLTGKDAFDLYQSYGFPLELSKEYAAQKGISIEEADFETEFRRHQELSRTASAGQFASGLADHSEQTVRYHTATHLLHQALRQVLGESVRQKGSNITAERLRFDFAWDTKVTPEQLEEVEGLVNRIILADLIVSVEEMSPQAAKESGALGFFENKYGEVVTVYSIGDFSKEICTGPHVAHTKELGIFKIQKEEAVSQGVRRIKAILV